jgi:hypothetical protein
MKSLLIILGAIFLVVGAIFYFMPEQSAAATTTTVGESAGADYATTKTTAANVNIPWPATLALLLIGLTLFILGLVIPDRTVVHRRADDVDYDVSTSEEVDLDTGRRRTTIRDVHRSARRL